MSRASSVVTIKLAWWAPPMAPMIKMQLGRVLRSFLQELEKAAAGESVDNLVPASS